MLGVATGDLRGGVLAYQTKSLEPKDYDRLTFVCRTGFHSQGASDCRECAPLRSVGQQKTIKNTAFQV